MATYYVDYVNGLDANNGLGPDASHSTNKPWKTMAKVLGASGVASGDTVWLSPAGPFRERVTVAMTSATAETFIKGDWSNSRGFKTSGGVLVAPGPVVWTAFETNDTSLPSASAACVDLAGRDYLTFSDIEFVGGRAPNPHCVSATTNTSTNITFNDCSFFGAGYSSVSTTSYLVSVSAAKNVALVHRYNRCLFFAASHHSGILIQPIQPDTADFDADVQINSCMFLGLMNRAIFLTTTAGGAFKVGGVTINGCLCFGYTGCINTGANVSTTYPLKVYNSVLLGSSGVNAGAASTVTADYNFNCCTTRYTNCTPTNDITDGSRAIIYWLGQSLKHGGVGRAAFTPFVTGSGMTGHGAGNTPLSYDWLNRTRPAGSQSLNITYGGLEVHDTAVKETSVVDAGSTSIKIIGPGDHDFFIPVDAESTTLSIRVRYDTTHAATNKPQVILLAQDAIGVSTETKTMTSGVDTWETLTFSAFTPTAAGVVVIRCVSRAAAGGGVAYFDTVARS